MINLASANDCDKYILEELYLANILAIPVDRTAGEVPYSYVGKIGNWTFKRRWYYWSASVENTEDGLPVDVALKLHNKKHPVTGKLLGDTVRVGGDAGGISPDDYVAQPVYNDEYTVQLEKLGYKKKYDNSLKKEYISITAGEIAELCKSGKLTVKRYVDLYHIDDQVGLMEFAKQLTDF